MRRDGAVEPLTDHAATTDLALAERTRVQGKGVPLPGGGTGPTRRCARRRPPSRHQAARHVERRATSDGARVHQPRSRRRPDRGPCVACRDRHAGGDVIFDLTRDEIDELLLKQVVGRIGCHAQGFTYVVPVIYAYDGDALYVASIDGQKVEMMRANPRVCFEVDTYGPEGWRSAIVQGLFEELSEAEAPKVLTLLRQRFPGGSKGHRRQPQTNGRPAVCFRIGIETVTGRAVERSAATRSASRRPTRTT